MKRRYFVQLGCAALGAFVGLPAGKAAALLTGEPARLHARPHSPKQRLSPGRHSLGLARSKDGLLFIPQRGNPTKTFPREKRPRGFLCPRCRARHRGGPAGLSRKELGSDREPLRQKWLRARHHLSWSRARLCLRLRGNRPAAHRTRRFSDGASYALLVGLTNGDLFTHVIAYSPGAMMPASQHGSPSIFVTQGTNDRVLPIDTASRRIVPTLKGADYRVAYREFPGGHIMKPEMVDESFQWFLREP